jgi:lipopolysaccharide transport system ATP-binding protein
MGRIDVSNLAKAYKQYPRRFYRLIEWLFPWGKIHHTLKWVIQDVSFSVKSGESVGIIGINGAGKSTLLKMITGTTQPTTGSVHISGRVAALLELGMGFHPDFTGRENAFMAGQLLGYSVEEMTRLMPEIEAFAEIGDYIDQPVRVYSSGMQVRLAFSVAIASRPDILIVDEALSVGDVYFQHKCFDRIRDFQKKGTTLLFVSHDKGSILSLCDRAILLSAGKKMIEGEPEVVLDFYNASLTNNNHSIKQIALKNGKLQTISGSGEVYLKSIKLLNDQSVPVEAVNIGESVILRVDYVVRESVSSLTIGFMVKDRQGQVVFGTNTHHLMCSIKNLEANQAGSCQFSFRANFGVGSYSCAVALHSNDNHITNNYEWRDLAAVFNVVNLNKPDSVGVCWLPVSVALDC